MTLPSRQDDGNVRAPALCLRGWCVRVGLSDIRRVDHKSMFFDTFFVRMCFSLEEKKSARCKNAFIFCFLTNAERSKKKKKVPQGTLSSFWDAKMGSRHY